LTRGGGRGKKQGRFQERDKGLQLGTAIVRNIGEKGKRGKRSRAGERCRQTPTYKGPDEGTEKGKDTEEETRAPHCLPARGNREGEKPRDNFFGVKEKEATIKEGGNEERPWYVRGRRKGKRRELKVRLGYYRLLGKERGKKETR